MATGAAQGGSRTSAESRRYEQTINRQLDRTRWQVKLTELGTSVLLLVVGVVGFLLVASLIDHWIVGFSYVGRALLLAVLLVGIGIYVWRQLLPLVVRSINPDYAARAIEESTPSLKNSLLNFLLLRRSPTGVKEVVLEALEKRAAADIADVPVETVVDRTKLIRMGYVLVGVTALFGIYKILSPKDPFQTAARVLAPWADISRPSRVQISEVQPGSTEVYLGETVSVSAGVSGVRKGDTVTLFYSTADGTTVDQPIVMSPAAGGRYEAVLPAGGDASRISSTGGLQQNATYRIEAGDAISDDYHLTVVAAPRIVVESVEYAFPTYTRKMPQSTNRGDLKGLEGTRVKIVARANQPIKSAWIEFDPQPDGGPAETLRLAAEGDRATGDLVLQLRPDRRSPWHSTYQIRFINDRQQQNRQPILHGIEVLRDLPPEVEIVTPQRREVEVPENGSQTIEVRAVDPDFGLTSVQLMGAARNKEVVLKSLIEPIEGQPPQILKRYTFRPSDWKLKAGETLTYWAIAEDNRTATPSASAVQAPPPHEPNTAKTEPYTIRIVAAQAGADQKPEGKGEQNSDDPQQDAANPQDSPMNGKQGDSGNKSGNQPASEKNSGENGEMGEGDSPEQGEGNKPSGQNGDSQKPQQQGSQNSKKQGDPESGDSSESGENDPQNMSQQGGGSSASNESGESGSENTGDSSQASEGGKGAKSGGAGQQSQMSEQQSGDAQGEKGEGAGGGNANSSQGDRSDTSEGQPGERTGEASDQPGKQGGSRGGQPSKKPEHDGDVFEELLKDIDPNEVEQGDSGSGGQQGTPTGRQQQGKSGAGQNNQPSGANDNDFRPMGDPQGEPSDSADGEQGDQTGDRSSSGAPKEGNARGSKSGKSGGQQGMNPQPQPDGNDRSPEDGDAEKGEGTDPMRPDNAQGKGPNDQKATGEGGRPQGVARTDEGDKQENQQSSGEQKDPGAGELGDSGAGNASKDKSGSGQGQETNRDRKKEMEGGDSKPESGETSAPSGSKRQSDSKGRTSGDRSGGGGKGSGQTGGQEGNDSAGSHSAADEGAGAANETGMGETGDRGGQGEKSKGQTGSKGNEKGEGSSTRDSRSGDQKGASDQPNGDPSQKDNPMSDGDESSDLPNNSPQAGSPGDRQPQTSSNASSTGAQEGGTGPVVGGGKEGNRQGGDHGPEGPATEADQANLEFARKATDLVLSKLKEQEHNPDPELLDRLGMSREQMQEFVRRWEQLKSEAERDPNAARELNEALRSLGLKDPKLRKRTGGKASDDQRNLRDSGNRIAPPSKYRDQFDAFRKGAARAK